MAKADLRSNIISDPQEKKRLKQAIIEMTHVLQRIDDDKEALTDLIKETSSKFGLPTKRIKKLASTMYKQNYSEYITENESFELLYEALFKTGGMSSAVEEDQDEDQEEEEV